MSLLVRGLCLAFLLTGLAGTPAAHAAPEDWRFLYAGGDLRTGTGELRSEIPVGISIDFPVARFSPDGSMLAAPGNSCDEECGPGEGTVRIQLPDATSVLRGRIPDFSTNAVSWSPDGSTVAVLGRWLTPADNDVRIYLIPANGSAPTQVYSDTRLLRISAFSGLSWHPTNGTLAFVATEFYDEDNGFARFENSDQVWTVPATANATPTRYTGRPACQGCDSFPGYRQPTWSPDGTRLAVSTGGADGSYVGYLSQGALVASKLVESGAQNQLAWSHDGEHLAYGIFDTSGDFYNDTEIVDADTGAVVQVVEGIIAPFTDWLPCPDGECQVWQNVYDPPDPFVNVAGVARRDKVIVSGSMGHVPEVTNVTVTLDRRRRSGAAWRRVTSVQVRAVEGMFRRSFPRPTGVQCRARAVYTDGTATATDTDVFSC